MSSRLILCTLPALLLCCPTRAAAQPFLQESASVGDQYRIEMQMQLSGKLKVQNGQKTIELDLSAQARHAFPERVLGIDRREIANKVVRHYSEANAVISVRTDKSERRIRKSRSLQVVQRIDGKTVTYCPDGPLTIEELETTGEHLDVMLVAGLLPGSTVKAGEPWKVDNEAAQALVGYDALTAHDLNGELKSVNGDVAEIHFTGSVKGIVGGAEAESVIEARMVFDLAGKRWTELHWKQEDNRDPGPVNPGSDVTARTIVKRTFGPSSRELSERVRAKIPARPSRSNLMIERSDEKGTWQFLHDRGWRLVAANDRFTVMRLLDRGELICQMNMTPLPKAAPGQHFSPKELHKLIGQSSNLEIEKVIQSGEIPDSQGRWIYQHSVQGKAGDLKVIQHYYIVAGPQGHQSVFTFTSEEPYADRVDGRDKEIVSSMKFGK